MPRHTPKQSFELLFTPRSPILFLLAALALGLAGEVLADLVKLYLAEENKAAPLWMIFLAALAILVVLYLVAYGVGIIRRRWQEPVIYRVLDFTRPTPARGLIAFVSLHERAHLEKALDYHGDPLQRVWLIATTETKALAEELQQQYQSDHCSVQVQFLGDPFNLLQTKQIVEHIFATQLGTLKETDVMADFTGGTKPMTVGMIFACLRTTRRLQYVSADYDGQKRVPRDPVEYTLDYDTVGALEKQVSHGALPEEGGT